ncbi:hypothetical protein J2Z48_001740 [Croceifilum oryzae]|uniref:Uncharacterized protein n=1 Tax=Croceifilum oryzae TaxID=1553429 RepID=A0AAJ1WQH7_9BACL|nr:hypothetical protein [Croceifilum oryzae]MDQ0417567.1 hypothetical protein [Croceifilum oryzae]
MVIASYESFLNGLKPSTYVNLDILSQPELIPALREYPSWNECENFWMFFRSESQREQFLSKYLNANDSEQHRLLGIELGFPPKAVDFYVKMASQYAANPIGTDRWYFANKVGVHYHGYNFASRIDDLEENIKWLWETYQIVDVAEVRFNKESYSIRYLSDSDLHKAVEEIVHERVPVLESAI